MHLTVILLLSLMRNVAFRRKWRVSVWDAFLQRWSDTSSLDCHSLTSSHGSMSGRPCQITTKPQEND